MPWASFFDPAECDHDMSQKRLEEIEPAVLDDLKGRVVKVARGLFDNKLVVSTSGVVSTRIPDTDYVFGHADRFQQSTSEPGQSDHS